MNPTFTAGVCGGSDDQTFVAVEDSDAPVGREVFESFNQASGCSTASRACRYRKRQGICGSARCNECRDDRKSSSRELHVGEAGWCRKSGVVEIREVATRDVSTPDAMSSNLIWESSVEERTFAVFPTHIVLLVLLDCDYADVCDQCGS